MNPSYTALEPDSLKILNVTSPTFKDGDTTFVATITFVYTLFVVAIVMAAFYRYVVAGTLRMQASENAIRQSNEMIKKATLGLLGVFSLFLILFTINKGLVTGDIGLGSLRGGVVVGGGSQGTVKTGEPTAAKAPAGAAGAPSNGNGSCTRSKCTQEDLPRITGINDFTIRNNLSGVAVNVGACTSVGQSGCTNVGGLPSDVVDAVKSLKTSCRCNVIISGGTEWWAHSTHGPGVSVLDLQIPRITDPTQDPLYQFLLKQTDGGSSGACTVIKIWNGWNFCDEKPGAYSQTTARHWHVRKN